MGMRMRFCTNKNTVLILCTLLCQIFLSYFLSWQAATGLERNSVTNNTSHDCGLHISTGPATIFLEGKKQNASSGKLAQRVLELISFFTRHINECSALSTSSESALIPDCSYWLIYCSIRR